MRDGRNLTRVTPAGQQVIDRAIKILREVQNIKRLSDDLKDEERGSLSIATTHTQARYVLPEVIKQFREQYPEVRLHLHQGTSEQIAEMAALDRIDFAIATGSQNHCSTASRCCRATAGTGTSSCRATIRWRALKKAHAEAARVLPDRHLRLQLHAGRRRCTTSSRRKASCRTSC